MAEEIDETDLTIRAGDYPVSDLDDLERVGAELEEIAGSIDRTTDQNLLDTGRYDLLKLIRIASVFSIIRWS